MPGTEKLLLFTEKVPVFAGHIVGVTSKLTVLVQSILAQA